MSRCRAACGHRSFVRTYQAERHRQEQAAEDVSIGYETEFAAYVAEHPLITFKDWLIQHAAPSDPSATVDPTPDDWEPPAGF